MKKEKFKTLVDKSGKYITIDFNIGDYLINKEYRCDILTSQNYIQPIRH